MQSFANNQFNKKQAHFHRQHFAKIFCLSRIAATKPILAQVIVYCVDRGTVQTLAQPEPTTRKTHLIMALGGDQHAPNYVSSQISRNEEDKEFAGQHPSLQTVCIVNCDTGRRILPNSVPDRLDNECFTGEVMLMLRTPDCDDPKEIRPDMGDNALRISDYLKGKARRFEFQFQIKLKKVPTGPLFLGCELEHPIKISRWTKGLAGVLLAMIRRINSGFHYSWGVDQHSRKDPIDPKLIEEGIYEKTHLSFPVEASMDRIIITKPGETPPQLGRELYESNESVKRRRRMGAGSVDWNLEDTYTMCLWSAYCDWIQWKSLNVPGVRPFPLSNVTAKQPIYLSVYELPAHTPQEYRKKRPAHYRKDLRVYTRLEFSNFEKTEGGLVEQLEGIPGGFRDHTKSECSIGGETESVVSEDLEKIACAKFCE